MFLFCAWWFSLVFFSPWGGSISVDALLISTCLVEFYCICYSHPSLHICFIETRVDPKKLWSSVFIWLVEYMAKACSSLERMSQIVIGKTRHYLIPDSTWCFLVVIYNPQFPLVDQRHEMFFWPIVCFLQPAGTASFRMVTPYAFKVFNLYYHNEIPWLSKSLWQFTEAKQKMVFICIASPHAHASEQSCISIAGCWILSSVSI